MRAGPILPFPSTGLGSSGLRPKDRSEDGGTGPASIAGFAPEFNGAQVGVIRPDRGDDGHQIDGRILGVLADDNDGHDLHDSPDR
jgi:hypothetical protein